MLPLVLAVVATVAIIVWLAVRRRRQRSPAPPTRTLKPSSAIGEDLQYVHYLEPDGLRQLATGLDLSLPVRQQVTEQTKLSGSVPHGPGAEDAYEVSSELAGSINLPALSRDIRTNVNADIVAADVVSVPSVESRDYSAAEAVVGAKKQALEATAGTSKLLLVRGWLQGSTDDDTGRMMLAVTHLSTERRDPTRSRGDGHAAALAIPTGIAIQLTLVSPDACTPSGRETVDNAKVFFGEAIAHTAEYDAQTGVFSCMAYAVWGCPAPAEDQNYDVGY